MYCTDAHFPLACFCRKCLLSLTLFCVLLLGTLKTCESAYHRIQHHRKVHELQHAVHDGHTAGSEMWLG